MPFSSSAAALQHYTGKKHKKNAENWSPYIISKSVNTKDDLLCDACNIIVGSSANMETHVADKHHQMKMKAHLDQINADLITPPMSARGFCDFNNLEREEANPVDPSRYTQPLNKPHPPLSADTFIPANPMHSSLNSGRLGGVGASPVITNNISDRSVFEMTYTNEFEAPGYSGDYDDGYGHGDENGNYASGLDNPLISMGVYGRMSGSNNKYSFSGDQGQFRPPYWEQPHAYSGGNNVPYPGTPARTSANEPCASSHFTPRGARDGNNIQNTLGPTKFKYNRK